MKYYIFNLKVHFYTLIKAKSIEEAVKIYNEEVDTTYGYLDEDEYPEEITKEKALLKFSEFCRNKEGVLFTERS